jgi:hypothetical protein
MGLAERESPGHGIHGRALIIPAALADFPPAARVDYLVAAAARESPVSA